MNDTFRLRMLSFRSSFEENEIWMICKATCFKQKADHNKKRCKYFFLISEAATGGILQKKVFLENFTNFTGKHLCWSLFIIKLQTILAL